MKSKKEFLFIQSFKLAKSNPGKVSLMVLFDISFLVSFFYVFPTLTRYFVQNLVISQTTESIALLAVLGLVYYLLILFAYSFFKYCVLDFIKSLFERTEFSFDRLGQFYALNIILLLPVFMVFSAVLSSIKEIYQPYVFIVLGSVIFLILYILVNAAHSLFYDGASLKLSLKKSFSITFTKMKVYREIILMIILGALILWLLFLGSGYLIRLLASKNYNLYLKIKFEEMN